MPEFLSAVAFANLLGGAGYVLFAFSPLAKTRLRYLLLHGVAMIPIAVHYVILDALPGAVLSLIYLVADVLGGWFPGRRWPLAVLTVLAILAAGLTFTSVTDLLGLAGTLIFILSRAAKGHRTTLAIAGISTITWGAFGWVENSWSQVLFSFAYAGFCALQLYRLGRST